MLIDHLNRELEKRDAQALRRKRRTAETPCAARQVVSSEGETERPMLTFCSNDYLGLANHPRLVDALVEGAMRFGAGSGGSHLISGHLRPHAALEADLAEFMSPCIPNARALYFCSGYMANLALLSTLGGSDATIFSDRLNHASLIDGARLAKATRQIFEHGDLDMLDTQLARCATPIKLIVSDGVFSMDGDMADLPALLALADRQDAWIIVDDAHGFGVLGAGGRGTLSHFGLCSERLIYMGTLGKAAGVGGAFIAAHPTIADWLLQTGRSYIYTTAPPPALAHALRESLRLIAGEDGESRRAVLRRHVDAFRSGVATFLRDQPGLGFRLTASHSAIQPLIVGANDAALALAARLHGAGIWVPAIRPPTVPADTARLRITLSADHRDADIERLVDALSQAPSGRDE